MVDAKEHRILRYSANGRYLGSIPAEISDSVSRFQPSVIKTVIRKTDTDKEAGTDLVLELANARFLFLDQDYRPRKKINIFDETEEAGLRSIFLWHFAGDDLISFSDVQASDGSWSSGFLRIPLDSPSRFAFISPKIDPGGPGGAERIFYRLGHPYISSLGTTAYFLALENPPRIYKHEKGSTETQPLAAFPSELRPRAEIPHRIGSPAEFLDLMKIVETTTMPTGLYGWKDHLYIVSRLVSNRGTQWRLSSIDPINDELLGSIVIPSDAKHLMTVPGPEHWAFIEKGQVLSPGQQKVNSILFVPSERMPGMGSNLVRHELCP